MKRIALHTLGCKLNFAETASLGKQFTAHGYDVVGLDDRADVVVINTCSVTERADRECRQLVRRALRHSPDAFVAVVGCYAQLQPEALAAIEGVDVILGTKEKFDLAAYVGDGRKRNAPSVYVSCIDDVHDSHLASSAGFEDRTRAFLKVQDGCDYQCAFCTIPLARGSSRSIAAPAVIDEARQAAALGYREIVLTGVNVGDYGDDAAPDLLTLVRAIAGIEGLERIRISSIEPNLLTDALLDYWITEPKLCKHWHIPLQSGSDAILRTMRRRYLTSAYRGRVERIRTMMPNAGIGADVIVGLPGETDDRFAETYEFLRDLPVTYLHVFSYSERAHTIAAAMPDQVVPAVKAMRSERLRDLSLRKRKLFAESFVGKSVPVLFEERGDDGRTYGLTEQYLRVGVVSSEPLTNQIRSVNILSAYTDHCEGVLV